MAEGGVNDAMLRKTLKGAIEEEQYQRRRRERMLDQITLICVRDRIGQLIDAGGEQIEPGATTEQRWGRNSRDTADQICRGIDEFDAE